MLIVAVLMALLVGVSLGMLGGGGSILTVPILRYVLGIEVHQAIATSLLVVGTTSLAALVAHARRGCVQWRTGLMFGTAGMLGAYLSGRVAHRIPAVILLVGLAVVMLGTAVAMLRPVHATSGGACSTRPESGKGPAKSRAQAHTHPPWPLIWMEGLAVGGVTGLVGAGGGFLVVPALVLLGHVPMDIAVGTSLLVIAMKSFAGFLGFLGHTPVDWSLALTVSAAAVLGSIGGSALVSRLRPTALRASFGWFVVAMACFILAQELPALFGRRANFATTLLVSAVVTSLLGVLRMALERRLQARRTRQSPVLSPVGRASKPAPARPSELGG